MKINDLSGLMLMAIADGAERALRNSGMLPENINQAQAFRIYGRSNVERWCKEGLLCPIDDRHTNTKKEFNRLKLEAVAKASNRVTYLSVAERRDR